jgi:hypothetical protein
MTSPLWSWFFLSFSLTALWLLTNKNRWGHALGLIKELIWIPWGYVNGQYGFCVSGAIFTVMFLRGFILWSKPARTEVLSERPRSHRANK